jgi:hypothetical protein
MKKLFYFVSFSLILICTLGLQPLSAQYVDDKGEWKFQQAIVLDGAIYAVEKCEKTLFGTCGIGSYQSVPAPIIAP